MWNKVGQLNEDAANDVSIDTDFIADSELSTHFNSNLMVILFLSINRKIILVILDLISGKPIYKKNTGQKPLPNILLNEKWCTLNTPDYLLIIDLNDFTEKTIPWTNNMLNISLEDDYTIRPFPLQDKMGLFNVATGLPERDITHENKMESYRKVPKFFSSLKKCPINAKFLEKINQTFFFSKPFDILEFGRVINIISDICIYTGSNKGVKIIEFENLDDVKDFTFTREFLEKNVGFTYKKSSELSEMNPRERQKSDNSIEVRDAVNSLDLLFDFHLVSFDKSKKVLALDYFNIKQYMKTTE